MSRPVHVHLLPTMFEPALLRGGVAVVIDVLRASTTICTALAAGADAVMPFRTIEAARTAHEMLPAGTALLGGERGGVRIAGFDLGNSPADYAPAVVKGKTVLFTTTNGTAALDCCKEAATIYIGAFVNLSRLFLALATRPEPLHLVCAGTDGVITAEDCLCAGAINDAFQALGGDRGNDACQLVTAAYRSLQGRDSTQSLLEALSNSRGGRNLTALDLTADIRTAATIDHVPVLPVYDPATNRLLRQ